MNLVAMPFENLGSRKGDSIPLSVPEIRGNEWIYIKECLDTNWVSSAGSFVERFERAVADYIRAKYAVATVNGTAALHIALLVAGVESDDEVLTSTLTFIAPANAVRYIGAWPVFIDAEPDYWQMDPQKVIDFLEKECDRGRRELRNKRTGRRVKAILPVHILGHPVDMDPIVEAAQKYGLVVIEDSTESLGARYKGSHVGTLGDIACFSFNGNKIITTGGGGMIVTGNSKWADRARYLTTQAKDDPIESVHREIGYNYRLTNIQAAMGCAQTERLDEYIVTKRGIAEGYTRALRKVNAITPMAEAPWASSIFWLYTVLINPAKFGMDRKVLAKHLKAAGVETRPLWQPLHLSPPYKNCQPYYCETAEKIQRDSLSIPCSVGLKEPDQQRVIKALTSAITCELG